MDANIRLATKYLENAQNSAKRMLGEYIHEHGGVIKIVNEDSKKSTIYAYIWKGDLYMPIEEVHINCIYYDDKYDNVYFHICDAADEDFEDFDKLREDRDNWYGLDNSECLVVTTLYSILGAIEEYAEDSGENS